MFTPSPKAVFDAVVVWADSITADNSESSIEAGAAAAKAADSIRVLILMIFRLCVTFNLASGIW